MSEEKDQVDISEKGRGPDGKPISSNRRLFMQLLALGGCADEPGTIQALDSSSVNGTLYRDVNDPEGIALLAATEDPDFFAGELRDLLRNDPLKEMFLKEEYTMLGRTYTIGYETDLDHILVDRPLQRITNPENAWAVWYPLRRTGAFQKLEKNIRRYREQKDKKVVTLNEEKFLAARAELDAEREEEKHFKEQFENAERPVFDRNFYMEEVLAIGIDYLQLLNENRVAKLN